MNGSHSLRSRITQPTSQIAVVFGCLLAVGFSMPALADPPCWAPAHGYRAKHGNNGCGKQGGRGDEAKRYRHDVTGGSSTDGSISTGGLVGAAVGGYAGSKVGKGNGKLAATAGGAVAGYIVGQEVERELTDPAR